MTYGYYTETPCKPKFDAIVKEVSAAVMAGKTVKLTCDGETLSIIRPDGTSESCVHRIIRTNY